ncbi:succinate dehydrogenase, hydrophobic membrane anchor protein [Marinibaculum pumilum]|uniref:Succinate dehydrogenase hydrophobic membrane anchor subunit n=1 Tax=Marinibaculum pumilum TaxID=1766165 RepID=A0ABV7L0Z9_9PROT
MSDTANNQFINAIKPVRGLGSAKDGTGHFWVQRVTAVALVPLVVVFALCVISITGADYEEARDFLGSPVVAAIGALLMIAGFWHLKLGMQVVIEDYIHGWLKLPALLLNTFGCIALGLACLIALAAIAFGG